MKVTLHYKHTNHSWLGYCSKEIIGLKLLWLLEHFSVPLAGIENLGTDLSLRVATVRLPSCKCAHVLCIYPLLLVCVWPEGALKRTEQQRFLSQADIPERQ